MGENERKAHCDVPQVTPQKAWGHFKTITRHKVLVMVLCFKVGLIRQGLLHDLSKYSPSEFLVGARYYQGDRSPNAAEREHRGFTEAWLHHKGRNKHHYEYWLDISLGKPGTFEGAPMPTRYVVEMFCDRIAACKVYQKDRYTDRSPLVYYRNNLENVTIHKETASLLEHLLETLAEQGLDETLTYVRRFIVKPKYLAGEQGRF